MTRVLFLALWIAMLSTFPALAAELTRYEGAVRVERGALIHTAQFLDRKSGGAGSASTVSAGLRDVFGQLSESVKAHGGDLSTVAKLNVYVSDAASLSDAREVFADTWEAAKRPAVTLIPTELPAGHFAACDAVAVAEGDVPGVVVAESASVMPANRDVLYVSGRAASGDLADATRGTMEQLFENLELFGSGKGDVVQIKAFLQPMKEVEVLEKEIEAFFPRGKAPPIVCIAWTSPSRATEIELIAAAPDIKDTNETVTYITPPGDKSSPVFSRVARVHANEVIYVSGLAGGSGTEAQRVQRVFAEMKAVTEEAGSDLRHLVKATYYVSTNEAGEALNEIRPALYDPLRPPAASKIMVPHTGEAGESILIDMIAVPSAPGAGK